MDKMTIEKAREIASDDQSWSWQHRFELMDSAGLSRNKVFWLSATYVAKGFIEGYESRDAEVGDLRADNLAQRGSLAKLDEAGIWLIAQNRKMREALEKIVAVFCEGNTVDHATCEYTMYDIAEEALKGELDDNL